MPKVFVKFPKTGLGNLMLVWAKARVFAELNNLELITSSWWGFRWGAILRRETMNRLYRHYFMESPLLQRIQYKIRSGSRDVVFDPDVRKLNDTDYTADSLFVFQKVINDIDLFGSIREHRNFIKEEIYKLLHPKRKAELEETDFPVVAVHIRRGDFKIGHQETPLGYFIDLIHLIREHTETPFPVTIFSDAEMHELKDILALPAVSMAITKSDISDILTMSRSRILITSQSSTFSYWAAFLSEALVIIPEGDWQEKIRGNLDGAIELKWSRNNARSTERLIAAMKAITVNKQPAA